MENIPPPTPRVSRPGLQWLVCAMKNIMSPFSFGRLGQANLAKFGRKKMIGTKFPWRANFPGEIRLLTDKGKRRQPLPTIPHFLGEILDTKKILKPSHSPAGRWVAFGLLFKSSEMNKKLKNNDFYRSTFQL